MNPQRSHCVMALSLLAVVMTFALAARSDTGETAGGQLTGPMIDACFAAVPILIAAIIAGLRHPRVGAGLWFVGTFMAVPLATWWLVPDWWVAIGPWPSDGELSGFNWRWDCVILLVSLIATLGLRARSNRA